MFHLAVRNDQLSLSQLQRNVFILHGGRVQIYGMAFLPHGRGKLIHDPALHPAVEILSHLAYEGDPLMSQIFEAVYLLDHQSGQDLDGCGR